MSEAYRNNMTPPETHAVPPPPGVDVEGGRPASVFRGLSDVQQWRKEDWMKKGVIVMRALALLFSFLSFIVIVTVSGFNNFEALNYLLAIAIIAMVYTAVQTGIKIHELCSGNAVIPPEIAAWLDFFVDQIMAYMLISSATSAATLENSIRLYAGSEAPGVHQASGAIAMSFLAFFSLSPAALISGYFLSAHLSK